MSLLPAGGLEMLGTGLPTGTVLIGASLAARWIGGNCADRAGISFLGGLVGSAMWVFSTEKADTAVGGVHWGLVKTASLQRAVAGM